MVGTQGLDKYLEAVYIMRTEGITVLPSRLADYLGVSRPTVTQTVGRLTTAGLAAMSEQKEISLTASGYERAEALVRRHRLLERWLTEALGLDWAEAHVEAARMEQSISPLVEDRLAQTLGYPTTCPHGNVIPGSGLEQLTGVSLHLVQAPERVKVIRIREVAEEELELLRFLYSAGLVPGAIVDVLRGLSPYEAGIQVEVEGAVYALDENVAARVLVRGVEAGDFRE